MTVLFKTRESIMTKLSVVILAAGKGTRMYSDLPKVLHKIAGKPMVKHVIDTAKQLNAAQIHLIYGHGADLLKQRLADEPVNWVFQAEQLGTGHAMQQAAPFFADDENILMLYGDAPLITAETLQKLIAAKPENGIALLTVNLENPTGYGRIIRQDGNVTAIVEQKDANAEQLKITEVNTGVMVSDGASFKKWLARVGNNNAQGEYFQRKQAQKLLLAGVSLTDPERFDLRGELEHGKDVEIDINVIIEGNVRLGNRVKIGAGCVLKNVEIADDVEIKPYSVLENAVVGEKAAIGPFSRLRPGAELAAETHVGNFVEIKQAKVGKGSKVNHLTYIGDAEIGRDCNIGAGVITCNYDGANKFKTVIGDNVFVGSDSQLIAPVTIADNVTVAAGATVTDNVAAGELVISRVRQRHIPNWKRPTKKK